METEPILLIYCYDLIPFTSTCSEKRMQYLQIPPKSTGPAPGKGTLLRKNFKLHYYYLQIAHSIGNQTVPRSLGSELRLRIWLHPSQQLRNSGFEKNEL